MSEDPELYEVPDESIDVDWKSGIIATDALSASMHKKGADGDLTEMQQPLWPTVGPEVDESLDQSSLSAVNAFAKFRASDLWSAAAAAAVTTAAVDNTSSLTESAAQSKTTAGVAESNDASLPASSFSTPASATADVLNGKDIKSGDSESLLPVSYHESPMDKLRRVQFEVEQLRSLAERASTQEVEQLPSTGSLFPGHSLTSISKEIHSLQDELNRLYTDHRHRLLSDPIESILPSKQLQQSRPLERPAEQSDRHTSATSESTSTSASVSSTQFSSSLSVEAAMRLERRLALLESAVGFNDLDSAPVHVGGVSETSNSSSRSTAVSSSGGGEARRPLFEQLKEVESLVSRSLQPSALATLEKRIKDLAKQQKQLKQSAQQQLLSVTDDEQRDAGPGNEDKLALEGAKLAELLSLVRRWEQPALMIPTVISRLETLAHVHRQAASAAQSMESLETRHAELQQCLEQNLQIRQELKQSFEQNQSKLNENFTILQKRMEKILSSMDKK